MIITVTVEEESADGMTVYTKEIEVWADFGKVVLDLNTFMNDMHDAIVEEEDQPEEEDEEYGDLVEKYMKELEDAGILVRPIEDEDITPRLGRILPCRSKE